MATIEQLVSNTLGPEAPMGGWREFIVGFL